MRNQVCLAFVWFVPCLSNSPHVWTPLVAVYEELAAREADLHVAAQAATALIEANQQLRTDCEALQARVSSLEEVCVCVCVCV